MTTRCLIYAHWDVNGIVDPYVLYALRRYRPTVERLVFVSTNYQVRSRELHDLADDVVVRDNLGFDFQSWREGLRLVGVDAFDEVVFANSSVYGPVWPMERVFAAFPTGRADVWGMTISCQHTVHLQSYFMAMSRSFLTSAIGRELWDDVVPFRNKSDCIEACELVWMGKCLAAGATVEALFDSRRQGVVPLDERLANTLRWPPRLRQSRRYRRSLRHPPLNPTHMQWKQLLECGVPFVKCDLFTLNPNGVHLGRICKWLEHHTEYPTDLIHGHVARLRRQLAA